METATKGSFIPPDTLQAANAARMEGGGFRDLFSLISIVLFIASATLAGGVFIYQQYLETSMESKKNQLTRATAAFEPSLVAELQRLDDRLNVSQEILNDHLAASVFFSMLEESTLSTVSFRTLALEVVDPQNITVQAEGTAKSVNSVALQAELFSRNGILSNPIFSNIDRREDGIRFTLTAQVNPSSIRYREALARAAAQKKESEAAPAEAQSAAPAPAPAQRTAAPLAPPAQKTAPTSTQKQQTAPPAAPQQSPPASQSSSPSSPLRGGTR